jgi:hypothetical protein
MGNRPERAARAGEAAGLRQLEPTPPDGPRSIGKLPYCVCLTEPTSSPRSPAGVLRRSACSIRKRLPTRLFGKTSMRNCKTNLVAIFLPIVLLCIAAGARAQSETCGQFNAAGIKACKPATIAPYEARVDSPPNAPPQGPTPESLLDEIVTRFRVLRGYPQQNMDIRRCTPAERSPECIPAASEWAIDYRGGDPGGYWSIYTAPPPASASRYFIGYGSCYVCTYWISSGQVFNQPSAQMHADVLCDPGWYPIGGRYHNLPSGNYGYPPYMCTVATPDSPKDLGRCKRPLSPWPINIATGNKCFTEVDLTTGGAYPLTFQRSYNSRISTLSPSLGYNWRH